MPGFRRSRQNLPLDLIALRAIPQSQPGAQSGGESGGMSPDDFLRLLDAIWRRTNLIVQSFVATNANPTRVRPAEARSYVFIQNQTAANQIIVNFGRPPGAAGVIPVDGLIIAPNFGFYEPLAVPQDEIWVIASAVNTAGVLIYAR